jgi:hypothetical protein
MLTTPAEIRTRSGDDDAAEDGMKRDTGREASLDEELTGAKGGERRLLGRLKDHGVAASQRRADLEGQLEGQRNV